MPAGNFYRSLSSKSFFTVSVLLLAEFFTGQQSFAAAGKLQEIIVTAQKRAESLQDVSVSVTALSGEKLSDFGIARLEEITAYIPNFVMSETGIGTTIYIRGIGSGINQGFEQSVGMYRDGIYYGRAQLARAPIFDMERVEVLRGPQVTLFGNNSIGGAVSMSASPPTDEFTGSFSYLGDFDHGEKETTLILSGPLTDSIGARVSIRKYELGGYLENKTLGRDEPQRDFLTTRLNFAFNSDDIDFVNGGLILERSTFDVKGRQIIIFQDRASEGFAAGVTATTFANAGKKDTLANLLSELPSVNGATVLDVNDSNSRYANGDFSINEINSATLTLNFPVGESELKSISGYLNYKYSDACDCDFTGAALIPFVSDEDYEQLSQEFRFTSNWDGPIEVIAGVYYQKDDLIFNDALLSVKGSALEDLIVGLFNPVIGDQLTGLSAPRNFVQKTELFSAFSQFTLNFREDLRLIAGIRRSNTTKEASRRLTYKQIDRKSALPELTFNAARADFAIGLQVSPHFEQDNREEWRTSYSFIVEWDINEDVLLYASNTLGFKTGGFDVRSNNATVDGNIIDNDGNIGSTVPNGFTPGTFEFEDEEANALELGIKTSIGGVVEINAAYFYTEIKNLQVSVFDGGVGFNVTNAAEAVTQGLELDWRAAVSEHWTLNGSLAWLQFEFKEYDNAVCTASDRLALANTTLGAVAKTETLFPGEDGIFNPGPFSDDLAVTSLDNGNCSVTKQAGRGNLYLADLSGETNQYVASYSGALSVNYENELFNKFLFRGALDVNFTDDYNPTQNLDIEAEQGGYEIYNLRLSLANLDGGWEVVLLGRNIFDQDVISYANDVPLATSQFGTVTKYGFLQRSKAWALQGRLTF